MLSAIKKRKRQAAAGRKLPPSEQLKRQGGEWRDGHSHGTARSIDHGTALAKRPSRAAAGDGGSRSGSSYLTRSEKKHGGTWGFIRWGVFQCPFLFCWVYLQNNDVLSIES